MVGFARRAPASAWPRGSSRGRKLALMLSSPGGIVAGDVDHVAASGETNSELPSSGISSNSVPGCAKRVTGVPVGSYFMSTRYALPLARNPSGTGEASRRERRHDDRDRGRAGGRRDRARAQAHDELAVGRGEAGLGRAAGSERDRRRQRLRLHVAGREERRRIDEAVRRRRGEAVVERTGVVVAHRGRDHHRDEVDGDRDTAEHERARRITGARTGSRARGSPRARSTIR